MTFQRFLLPVVLAVVVSACGGTGDDLDPADAALLEEGGATSEGEQPVAAPGAQVQVAEEVVLDSNAVAVGSATNPDGAVSAGKATYTVDDTIYASVPVGGYGPGKEVIIYWFSSAGVSVKDERKAIPGGAKFVNFSLSKADGMKPGSYTAQIDIDDTPVGMADFIVK